MSCSARSTIWPRSAGSRCSADMGITDPITRPSGLLSHDGARRRHRADASRQVPADRRGHAAREHGDHIRIRRGRTALPGPGRPRRRARHPDLASRSTSAPTRSPPRCRHCPKVSPRSSASWPQPPRLRRRADRGQPDRCRRAAAEHLVRRTRPGRGGGTARATGNRSRSSTTRSSPRSVDRALADAPDATRILAWTDTATDSLTVEQMISRARRGRHPCGPPRSPR